MSRLALMIVAAAGVTGCYFRTPVREASPATGSPVRVTLTQEGSVDLAKLLGAQIHTLDGRVVSSSHDTLAIAVSRAVRLDDSGQVWHGEHVAIPRTDISVVDHRHLSVPATALIVAGVTTAAVLAGNAVKRPPVLH